MCRLSAGDFSRESVAQMLGWDFVFEIFKSLLVMGRLFCVGFQPTISLGNLLRKRFVIFLRTRGQASPTVRANIITIRRI